MNFFSRKPQERSVQSGSEGAQWPLNQWLGDFPLWSFGPHGICFLFVVICSPIWLLNTAMENHHFQVR